MTELQLDVTTTVPMWLFTLFAVNTVVLITVHVFSLVISTCLLPTMEAISQEYQVPSSNSILKAVPTCSPHDKLCGLVSTSVMLSSVLGLLLFLLEVALLAWVKFWDHARSACWAGSLVMAPAVIVFILFCWHFRRVLNEQAYQSRHREISQMHKELVTDEPQTSHSDISV